MKYSIDVHVIMHPHYDRTESRERLLAQLANEPVNVYLTPGTYKHIGRSRYDGFTQGSAPLCSYVDDDDLIEPGIFTKCLKAFEDDPSLDGLCTREVIHGKSGSVTTSQFSHLFYDHRHLYDIHHLPVFSRAVIEPYLPKLLDLPDGAEHSLWAYMLLDDARILHIPEIGYHWNIHEENSGTLNIPIPQKVSNLHFELMHKARSLNYVSHIPENKRTDIGHSAYRFVDSSSIKTTGRPHGPCNVSRT